MHTLGCLLILFLLFPALGTLLFRAGIDAIRRLLQRIGDIAVWLYQSFLNIFRRDKHEVINPFTGLSNFDDLRQDEEIAYEPTETPEKIFNSTDGEYIDYTEL